jgi:hypothetical protein
MKEKKRKRERYDSESESSDSFTSTTSSMSSFSSSLSSSSSSSSSSSLSKRRKKSSSGGKKSRRRKEKRRKKTKEKRRKKEKKRDAHSKRRRPKRREDEVEVEPDLEKKMMMMTKETETTTVAPSVPRDDHMSNENNDQHEAKNVDTPASVDATPPVPGFGAAMTLEQYRELAKQKTYLRGTVHAKDKAEADAENKDKQDKLSRGWWPCQSYKCDGHMNPKMMDKCNQCGAMRTLSKSGATFKHRASDAQIAFNANRR